MNSTSLYYYIASNGETAGPVPYADLQSYLKSGLVKPTTPICKVGDAAWAPFLPNVEDGGFSAPNTAGDRSSVQMNVPAWMKFALWALVAGVFLNILLPVVTTLLQKNEWEYRVMEFSAKPGDKNASRTVDLDIEELQMAGKNGWEIAGQWLEHETVFPNFGKDEFVTGLQPNFRPSKLLILLKRKTSHFLQQP